MSELEITNDGLRLVKSFEQCRTVEKRYQDHLQSARKDLKEAEQQLVQWLVPKSASAGEVFCLAIGDAFFEVRVFAIYGVSEGSGEQTIMGKRYELSWRDNRMPRKGL